MAWNPAVYNKFKQERATPFFDLLALVKPANNMRVIDLGCGTGELTSILSQNLPGAMVKGIDSSAEMLEKMSNLQHDHLSFELLSIQDQLNKKEKWDLVFSNAALQWVNDHEKLFPQLISQVNAGGQIAVQMPAQSHNLTNILLNELADESPFRESLQEFKRSSPVLNSERYAAILFENGAAEITVLEKIYPLILPDVDSLYSWVSGTALIPYLERLSAAHREAFTAAYRLKLAKHFGTTPVFYPFKRILLHAQF